MIEQNQTEDGIRGCGRAEADDILTIINAAAEAYRGVIPPDRLWIGAENEPSLQGRQLAVII